LRRAHCALYAPQEFPIGLDPTAKSGGRHGMQVSLEGGLAAALIFNGADLADVRWLDPIDPSSIAALVSSLQQACGTHEEYFDHRANGGHSVLTSIDSISPAQFPLKQALMNGMCVQLHKILSRGSPSGTDRERLAAMAASAWEVLSREPAYLAPHPELARMLKNLRRR
jgi:hypothetical protein